MGRAWDMFKQGVLGPLILYGLLLGHVAYQVSKTPKEIIMPTWPVAVSRSDREALIKARKPLVEGLMDMAAAKNVEFAKKFCTEDIQYEDPLQKISGVKEFDLMTKSMHKFIKHAEFEFYGEHHSLHEIVLDWKVTVTQRVMSQIKLPMYLRTHLLLEPPATKGGTERVFKVIEEWGGNSILNEKNTWPSLLGKTHSKLRQFHGFLTTKIFDLIN